MSNLNNQKGFSLLETILYVAILVSFLTFLVAGALPFFDIRVKNEVISEVNGQAALIVAQITQEARLAHDIVSPSPAGATSTTLTLDMVNSTSIFKLEEGVIKWDEVPLTSDRVKVTDLLFTNLSRAGTSGIIKMEFTITYDNPGDLFQFNYINSYQTAASLRN